MSKRVLDEAISTGSASSDIESSIEDINTDDYRIDVASPMEATAAGYRNAHKDEPPYNLESTFGAREDDDNQLLVPGNDESEEEQGDYNDTYVPDIVTPPRERKRVRFGANEKDDSESLEDMNPWDFRKVLRQLYREQLPDTYQIRNWKRPSRNLVSNFIELIENNVEMASDEVFQQYGSEIDMLFSTEDERNSVKDKLENKLFDTIYNIKKRLRRTKMPSKIWVDNLNMEYVYAKGEFIKNKYEAELDRAEEIERQLIREEEYMKSMQESIDSKAKKHKDTLVKELSDLTKQLHPSLTTALSNTFGLIKDSKMSNEVFQRDKIRYNLRLKTDFSKPLITPTESNSSIKPMPELADSKTLINDIMKQLDRLGNPDREVTAQETTSS